MSRSRKKDEESQVGLILERVDVLDRRQEKIETILMIRDPGSAVAADAYEGLRKQVINAASDRMAHLAQLVQFSHALAGASSVDELRKHVAGWIEQAALEVLHDPDHPESDSLFEVLGGEGPDLELIEPAYRDGRTGRVVRQGRLRRVTREAGSQPGSEEASAGPELPAENGSRKEDA